MHGCGMRVGRGCGGRRCLRGCLLECKFWSYLQSRGDAFYGEICLSWTDGGLSLVRNQVIDSMPTESEMFCSGSIPMYHSVVHFSL